MAGALADTAGNLERPTLQSLVSDAERAAIDIVKRLGGEECKCILHSPCASF